MPACALIKQIYYFQNNSHGIPLTAHCKKIITGDPGVYYDQIAPFALFSNRSAKSPHHSAYEIFQNALSSLIGLKSYGTPCKVSTCQHLWVKNENINPSRPLYKQRPGRLYFQTESGAERERSNITLFRLSRITYPESNRHRTNTPSIIIVTMETKCLVVLALVGMLVIESYAIVSWNFDFSYLVISDGSILLSSLILTIEIILSCSERTGAQMHSSRRPLWLQPHSEVLQWRKSDRLHSQRWY